MEAGGLLEEAMSQQRFVADQVGVLYPVTYAYVRAYLRAYVRVYSHTYIYYTHTTMTEVHTHSTHMHACRVANDHIRWSGSASVVSWVVSLAPVLYRHESLAALQSACPQVKIRASSRVTGWAVYPSAMAALAGRQVSCACSRAHVCMHACACLCGCVIHKPVHPYN